MTPGRLVIWKPLEKPDQYTYEAGQEAEQAPAGRRNAGSYPPIGTEIKVI